MNNTPLISVIIPAYNTRDVIEKTLKSIEEQTYQNYQIIIIDDGSTDDTGIFIDEYQQKNAKIIVYHQNNSGVSVARNNALKYASGEFICFLDSDDTYESSFFEKMLIRQQQTDFNIVYCGFYRVKKNKSIKEYLSFEEGNILNSFIKKSFHISGMLIKRSFLLDKNITFDTDLKICEDIFFTIKAISQCEVAVVKDHLFNYLYREKSVTNSIATIELYLQNIVTWERIEYYLKHNYIKNDKEEIYQRVQSIVVKLKVRLLIEYLKQFNYKKIYYYLNKDLKFTSDMKLVNKKYLPKSDIKKMNIIKSNCLAIWFWGSLYYRYIRRETGK
ncbi:glycosyltransferase family 2 protein [Gilliamella sp. Occ4-3]|uniref:glycosyltransferase family 2 protein n=1 Tax=Gilliamella sp. Occ4-3 TaxID=3120254 RepID=UPI00080DED8F|nr:glycosyltransferase family 2 protein [Gilliamella apicola]OCG76816.1 hypothetical protein A9G44_06600 [Gilliamella apicola]